MQTIVNSTNNNNSASNNNRKSSETVTSLPELQAERPTTKDHPTETKKDSLDSTEGAAEALAQALGETNDDGSETIEHDDHDLLLPKLPPATVSESGDKSIELASEQGDLMTVGDVAKSDDDSLGGTKVSFVNSACEFLEQ